MFCNQCGSSIKPGARFCGSCGATAPGGAQAPEPLGSTEVFAPVTAAPTPAAPAPVAPVITPPSEGGSKALIITLIVVLVIILGAGGAFAAYEWGGLGNDRVESSSDDDSDKDAEKDDERESSRKRDRDERRGDDEEDSSDNGGSVSEEQDADATLDPNEPPADLTQDLSALATLKASSQLPNSGANTYGPGNLIDGRDETCWAEGKTAKGDYGIGENVRYTFQQEVWISEFRVVPGYLKYDDAKGIDRWFANGRVKTADVVFADGSRHTFSFTDDKSSQTVRLPRPVKTTSVAFVIMSARPANSGTSSDASDTSIAEVHVIGAPAQ